MALFTIWRKDMRLTRTAGITWLGILILFESLLLYVAHFSQGLVKFSAGCMLMALVCHVFYFPVHILTSLNREWRRSAQLWLHLPKSGRVLFGSKMAVGLVSMVISLIVMYGFGLALLEMEFQSLPSLGVARGWVPSFHDFLSLYGEFVLFSAVALLWFSLYVAVWVGLIFMVLQTMKHNLPRIRWLVSVAVVLIPTWGFTELARIPVLQALMNWGKFRLHFWWPQPITTTNHISSMHLWTGQLVFFGLVTVLVFWLCGWLLDRKVEV